MMHPNRWLLSVATILIVVAAGLFMLLGDYGAKQLAQAAPNDEQDDALQNNIRELADRIAKGEITWEQWESQQRKALEQIQAEGATQPDQPQQPAQPQSKPQHAQKHQQQQSPSPGDDPLNQARIDQLIEQRIDAILDRKVDQYIQESVARHIDTMLRQGGQASEAMQPKNPQPLPQPIQNVQPQRGERDKEESLSDRIKALEQALNAQRQESQQQMAGASAVQNDQQPQAKPQEETNLDRRAQELIAEFKAAQEQREAAKQAQRQQNATSQPQQQPQVQQPADTQNVELAKGLQEAIEQIKRQKQNEEENQHQGAAGHGTAAPGATPQQ